MSIWILSIFILSCFRPAICEEPLYKKEGSEVILIPDKSTGPIKSILWKQGDNFAMEYIGDTVTPYLHFQGGHGSLNPLNGEMTIRGLTRTDTGLYTVEINNEVNKKINLKVIASVLKPNVSASCDTDHCDLTCVGDTVEAAPVSFLWIIGSNKPQKQDKEYRLTKDVNAEFIQCELENPVSSQQSDKLPNPFFSVSVPPSPTNIIIGVVVALMLVLVGICLTILWKKGIIRIPGCGPRGAGHDLNQHKYEKAAENEDDANNRPEAVTVEEPGTSPEPTQTPNGTEAVPVEETDTSVEPSVEPTVEPTQTPNGTEKAAANDDDANNGPEGVTVQEPGTSPEPTQTPNGTGVQVSADVHRNTGNDTGPPHEDQTGSGYDSGDAPTSSDNHGNADNSNSINKPDDDESAQGKKPEEGERGYAED